MNPVALYDALDCASMSLLQAESRNGPKAEAAYLEASIAATGAFPEGSREAQALNVILGAVRDMAGSVTP
jgi:hypothetical protein